MSFLYDTPRGERLLVVTGAAGSYRLDIPVPQDVFEACLVLSESDPAQVTALLAEVLREALHLTPEEDVLPHEDGADLHADDLPPVVFSADAGEPEDTA